MITQQITCKTGVFLIGLLATACVQSNVNRTGRARLGGGSEGSTKVFEQTPAGYQEIAVIDVNAAALGKEDRLERHLLRQASLLGCDGVVNVRTERGNASAICLKHLSGTKVVDAIDLQDAVVLNAPDTLRRKAAQGGAYGIALLKAIERSQNQAEPTRRGWPLKWYVENYPQSPFIADVEALFVSSDEFEGALASAGAPASVRTAPEAE